jgi:hypothetical protein
MRDAGGREEILMQQREHPKEDGESLLVRECEAFLKGTLAEHLDELGIVVPVWAWTNLLAHGGPEQVTDCVCSQNHPRRSDRDWSVARALLAFEIFDLMEAGYPLEELQQDVLIPLELELASRPEVSRWTPRQWLDTVDEAIRSQQVTFGL